MILQIGLCKTMRFFGELVDENIGPEIPETFFASIATFYRQLQRAWIDVHLHGIPVTRAVWISSFIDIFFCRINISHVAFNSIHFAYNWNQFLKKYSQFAVIPEECYLYKENMIFHFCMSFITEAACQNNINIRRFLY